MSDLSDMPGLVGGRPALSGPDGTTVLPGPLYTGGIGGPLPASLATSYFAPSAGALGITAITPSGYIALPNAAGGFLWIPFVPSTACQILLGDAGNGFVGIKGSNSVIGVVSGGSSSGVLCGLGISIQIGASGLFQWSQDANGRSGAYDLSLSRPAAATLQQGAANAAAPVAQTLQAQGSRAGTDSNVGGANYTHASGQGTGIGALSSLIFQSPVAVASGTGAQTMTTGATIKNGCIVLPVYTVAALPVASTVPYGKAFVSDALAPTFGSTVANGGSAKTPVWSDGTNWIVG